MISKHKRNHKNHSNTVRVRRAPKGFFFKIQPDGGDRYVYVWLWHRNEDKDVCIGRVHLMPDSDDPKAVETHSRLDPLYWGKGLGALMYAKAIAYAHKQGWKVRSSNGPSAYAQRVWSGHELKKYFRIVRKNRKNTGWVSDRWFAYPKG